MTWSGAQLFRSVDAGSTYNAELSTTAAAAIGVATTALADFTGGNIFDDGSSVTVRMRGGAQLISYTRAQVLNGAGLFTLGVNGRWEIVQYMTATLVAADTYTLTGLLRGRRGTEWAIGTHAIGDHFILASALNWKLYDPGAADINVSRLYKAPAFKTSLTSAAAQSFTDKAVRYRPYSVANLVAVPVVGGYSITWNHRSILNSEWADTGDVPLDATFVRFVVTIKTIEGVPVKSHYTTGESLFYTTAQIAADFGYAATAFQIHVAQENSNFGPGVGVTITNSAAVPVYDAPAPYVTAPPIVPPDPPDDADPVLGLTEIDPRYAPFELAVFGPWKLMQSLTPNIWRLCTGNGRILASASSNGDVYSLNLTTGKWYAYGNDNLPSNVPGWSMAQFVDGGVLHVIGFNESFVSDLEFDEGGVSGSRWTPTTTPVVGTIPAIAGRWVTAYLGGVIYFVRTDSNRFDLGQIASGYGVSGAKADFTTAAVSSIAELPAGVYDDCCGVGYGSKIYVFGGVDSSGARLNTTWIYDTVTDVWSAGPATPLAFSFGSAVVVGSLIYLLIDVATIPPGGPEGIPLYTFDPVTNAFALKTTMPRCYSHAGMYGVIFDPAGFPVTWNIGTMTLADNGKIYIVSQPALVGSNYQSITWEYDPALDV